jgi:hypothetical protein
MALDMSRIVDGIGFRVDGATPYGRSGAAISVADLNGDGLDDLVIGAPQASPAYTGETFVVYGTRDGFPDELNLGTIESGSGFRIDGVAPYDYSGQWVTNAGDLNGDGVEDLAIGARNAGTQGARAYVVFGTTGGFGETLELADLDGDVGFRIHGIGELQYGGSPISGDGDLNGDGFDDLVIGGPTRGEDERGRTYVVFGAADGIPARLDPGGLDGDDGFWLEGVSD